MPVLCGNLNWPEFKGYPVLKQGFFLYKTLLTLRKSYNFPHYNKI